MEILGGCCTSTFALIALAGVGFLFAWRYIFVVGVPCKSKRRLDGKTVIITGANTGIGKVTAIDLAKRGARVIIGCRDISRGSKALEDIKNESKSQDVVLKKLDLASLTSVRQFSEEILKEEGQINVLINNAGVMMTPYSKTEDGFEIQFGVNHLGHFLLTNLLLDRIKQSTPSRIVTVSSHAHRLFFSMDFDDLNWERTPYNTQLAYGRSKAANVMFSRELAKRLEDTGVTTYSLHPGSIDTELPRHLTDRWKIWIVS